MMGKGGHYLMGKGELDMMGKGGHDIKGNVSMQSEEGIEEVWLRRLCFLALQLATSSTPL
jgi:hypothetical protein